VSQLVTVPAEPAGPAGPAAPVAGHRRRGRSGERGFRLLTLLPLLGFLVAFTAYPVIELVRMSLSDVQLRDGAFQWQLIGADHYQQAGSDDTFRYSIGITALFIVVTVVLTVVLGTALALLVDRSVVLAGLARNVLLWPALIAPVVVSVMWFLVLSPNVGALNKLLASLGLGRQGWLGEPTGAVASIIIVDVWHWTPLVFVLIYSAVQGIDRQLLEAARVDGAPEWVVYRRIVLPLLAPAIAAAALIRLTMGAKAFDEMYLLTHGGPGTATTLVSLYIRNVFFDQLRLGYGAAISVVVIIAVAVAVGLALLGRSLVRVRSGVG
jgi:multiple sugar transport system permease protein